VYYYEKALRCYTSGCPEGTVHDAGSSECKDKCGSKQYLLAETQTCYEEKQCPEGYGMKKSSMTCDNTCTVDYSENTCVTKCPLEKYSYGITGER